MRRKNPLIQRSAPLATAVLALFAACGLAALSGGCEQKNGPRPPAAPVLDLEGFEEPPGAALSWAGGTVRKGHATGGAQSYEMVFQGEKNLFYGRAGNLPPEVFAHRKLLVDVENPTAPFPVYWIIAGPTKDRSVIYDELWVPYGLSTLEIDLALARAAGLGERDRDTIQIGPEKPDEREIRVYLDSLRAANEGSPGPAAEPPMPPEGAGALIPNGGFEEGLAGWTPRTWGLARVAIAVVRGSEARSGTAAAAIFRRVDGLAGLVSPPLDLLPGRYSLCLALRGRGDAELRVEREEIQTTPGGDAALTAVLLGTVRTDAEWTEKTVEIEVPPADSSADAREHLQSLRLRLLAEKGDLFLDEIVLAPKAPGDGGPVTTPPAAAPWRGGSMTLLGFGPPFTGDGASPRGIACDLGPALLGGGPAAGVRRILERRRGDPDVRLWLLGASAQTSVLDPSGAVIGMTPGGMRAARRALGDTGRAPVAVCVRTDRRGQAENFADTAEHLCGGISLRAARAAGGLDRFAESLGALRKAGEGRFVDRGVAPGVVPGSPARGILAWIDLRELPGDRPTTAGDLRAMVYLALVEGCGAAVLAPFEDLKDPGKINAEIERIAGELAEAGLQGDAGTPRLEISDRRLSGRLVRARGGQALILVNPTGTAVENATVRLSAEAGDVRQVSLGAYDGRIERIAGR